MPLSYNLAYQEIILVHPTRRQIFTGKPYATFWNIWEWVIPRIKSEYEAKNNMWHYDIDNDCHIKRSFIKEWMSVKYFINT